MTNSERRQFLKDAIANLARAAGSVLVASAAAQTANAQEPKREEANPPEDVRERADRLGASGNLSTEEAATEANEFLNGGFRNTPLGRFRNTPLGGFRNTPLGNFANTSLGAFRNTPLSTFGNGGWPNGNWGGFHNGGWPNMGWRNGW
jgi:hypothetical protein